MRACRAMLPDADGDGGGDASCLDAIGMPLGDDCDDHDANRFRGNREVCDAHATTRTAIPRPTAASTGRRRFETRAAATAPHAAPTATTAAAPHIRARPRRATVWTTTATRPSTRA